jgi:hypothetical protein
MNRYIFAGNTILHRVASIRKVGKRLGDRKQVVNLRNGDVYTIEQLDRDYFEVNGPHLTHCQVKGWIDGAKLVNGI